MHALCTRYPQECDSCDDVQEGPTVLCVIAYTKLEASFQNKIRANVEVNGTRSTVYSGASLSPKGMTYRDIVSRNRRFNNTELLNPPIRR
jgi:hypothetical protein